jgi:predicted ATPase
MTVVAGPQRLLEREAELERLSALLAAAQAGRGAVAAVEGPAGIGKTSLLEALQARIDRIERDDLHTLRLRTFAS